MASIKMQYVVQSCPRCHKKLLKVPVGTTTIGSPLVTCKNCNQKYKTTLREEWYAYNHKAMVFVIPILIPVAMLLVGALMEDLVIGIMAAIFGLLIGLCICLKDVIKIIMSVRRMRDVVYLAELLEYGAITQEEYDNFKQKAA